MNDVVNGDSYEFPVSATQATFWYMFQMDRSSTAYSIPLAFSIRGKVDAEQIHASIQYVVQRHEILRTAYHEKPDGTLVQRVLPDCDVPFKLIDIAPGETQQQELDALLEAEYRRPVLIDSEPVLRARLYRLAEDDYVFLLVGHHIAFDHFAFGLFLTEMAAHYRSIQDGGEHALPEPDLQYADYVVWKQEQEERFRSDEKKAVWKKRLENCSGVLNLATTLPRPKFQTFEGRDRYFSFSAATSNKLREFGKTHGYSLFHISLACLSAVYQRYSRQDDIVVGTPFSDRNQGEELEDVMGCFINTLPLAMQFRDEMSFLDLLASIKEVMVEAYDNQMVPLEDIIHALGTPRDLSRNPLFQVGFVFQDPPMSFELPQAEVAVLPIANFGAMYDLHTFMWDSGDSIGGLMTYNTQLFDRDFVDRFLQTLEAAAAQLVSQPDSDVRKLTFLSESDRAQLDAVNATQRDYDLSETVLDLVARQTSKSATDLAVLGDDGELTYASLDAQSTAFAAYLVANGIKPKDFVGISVSRSADMLVAIFGIWKAGAAYVPLDPGYPAERLEYMMRTASISALVTQEALEDKFPPFDCPRLRLDADRDIWLQATADDGAIKVQGDDLAYVIFTSGSTGQPKGVQIAHSAVANLMHSMLEAPGIQTHDRMLAVVTLSFDMSVPELYLPLCRGAAVVVATAEQAADGRELLRLIDEHDITMMNATPATYRLMLDEGWLQDGDWSEFTVLCAGEAFPLDLARTMAAQVGSVWNMYGPTETTVYSTGHRIDPANVNTRIGRPVNNTGVHILNELGRAVPVGVPGVLHVSGAGLSNGYLNRDELTAKSFFPFPENPGLRVYCTGDLVVLYPDGELDYLHRLDGQVKLRGYRIELGEIETVLAEQDNVSKVVANVWSASHEDQRLVAYVIPERGKVSAIKLRKALRSRLPDFMIPQHFVEVTQFPLTANGKIDRKALPSPLGMNKEVAKDPPQTDLEKSVASIWSDILGEERIYRDDNFFDIGGHSLLAVKVISVVEKKHGIRLNPRMIVMQSLAEIASTVVSEQ